MKQRLAALVLTVSLSMTLRSTRCAHADPSNAAPVRPSRPGTLTPQAIRSVVLAHIGQVTRCHEAALSRRPALTGRVTVRFIIDGNGAVTSSAPIENTTGDAQVGDCIAQAIRAWPFPRPEGGGVVTVNYPFTLQRAE